MTCIHKGLPQIDHKKTKRKKGNAGKLQKRNSDHINIVKGGNFLWWSENYNLKAAVRFQFCRCDGQKWRQITSSTGGSPALIPGVSKGSETLYF